MNNQKVILAHPAKVNGKIEPAGKELTVSREIADQLRAAGAMATGGDVLEDALLSAQNVSTFLTQSESAQEYAERVDALIDENEALKMKVELHDAEMEEAREIDQGRVAQIDELKAIVAELTAKLAASTSVDVSTEGTVAKSAEDAPPVATKAEPKPAKAAAKAATGKAS